MTGDIAKNTLIIFMNDNGGTVGVDVWNAGMRGSKNTPWLGGTRAASFWRWPGVFASGDREALTAHIDFFPTLAELAGVELKERERKQIEGRSLVPLLRDSKAPWPERTLVTHIGRWKRGQAAAAKFANCAVRTPRWHLVTVHPKGEKAWQLFDVQADPREQNNLATTHPEIVDQLDAAYSQWWDSIQPQLVNEAAIPPAENAFATLYRKQFGALPQAQEVTFEPRGFARRSWNTAGLSRAQCVARLASAARVELGRSASNLAARGDLQDMPAVATSHNRDTACDSSARSVGAGVAVRASRSRAKQAFPGTGRLRPARRGRRSAGLCGVPPIARAFGSLRSRTGTAQPDGDGRATITPWLIAAPLASACARRSANAPGSAGLARHAELRIR